MFTRFARAGRWLAVLGVVLIGIAGLSPFGNALILPLEQRFPAWDASRGAPDGIVVLGGAIGPAMSDARGEPSLNEFRRAHDGGRGPRAALSHGPHPVQRRRRQPDGRQQPRDEIRAAAVRELRHSGQAHRAGRQVAQHGRERGLQQGDGRSEAWRALAARDLGTSHAAIGRMLPPRRFCRRALSGRLAHARALSISPRRSAAWPPGLARTDVAAREWVGLLAYWITGRTSELLPGPN